MTDPATTITAHLTLDGQITIPLEIRQQLKLLPGTEFEFEVVGETLQLRKKVTSPTEALISRMRGSATVKLTTDEILTATRQDV